MAKQIKCILINVDNVLISEIIELPSELGEPDCKLVKPHKFFIDGSLKPWLGDINPTDQTEFMIHSDKILTIADPTPEVIAKYLELTK
jgi:hypothetical protein